MLPTFPPLPEKLRVQLRTAGDEIAVDLKKVTEWSENNARLFHMIKEDGYLSDYCCQQFIYNFYTKLTFVRCKVEKIEPEFTRFSNLIHLNLTYNSIAVVQNLPPSLKELLLSINQVKVVKAGPALQLLSVGKNGMGLAQFQQVVAAFPGLKCLDISYNSFKVDQFPNLLAKLKTLKELKVLIIKGNSFCVLEKYNELVRGLPSLKFLDEKLAAVEEPKVEKVEEPPVQEKKDDKKGAKKDAKKDAKK